MAPGTVRMFDASMFEPEGLSEASMLLKKVLVTFLGLSAPLAVIRRPPHNDSAPGELRPFAPPLVTPLFTRLCWV